MRNNMPRVKYVETPEEFFSLLTDTSLIVKHVHILGDRIARVDFTYHDDFIEEGKSVNVVIAAYTTAYSTNCVNVPPSIRVCTHVHVRKYSHIFVNIITELRKLSQCA